MSPTPLAISETELQVLKVLWERGTGTVRELRDWLADEGTDWAYTTVQTLLTRLQQKSYVASDRRGRAHVFRPSRSREEFLGEHLDDLADRVCEGTTLPLVLSLVQGRSFSSDEIQHFRQMLDDLEDDPEAKGGKAGKGKRGGKASRTDSTDPDDR